MRFVDKNQTLVAPEGYTFRNVETEGCYLKLTYYQSVYKTDLTPPLPPEGYTSLTVIGENIVVVFLNDSGREVGRSVASYRWPEPDVIEPRPMLRRFRIWNGFLIALYGLREMIKWQK